MSQLYYYARRTVVSVLLIFAIATFLFFAFRFMPGDYATLLLQQGASPEQVAKVRQMWGLDQPLYVQYFKWLGNMLQGNAGMSRQFNKPVLEVVLPALRNSLIVALPGVLVAFVLGSLYGALMGSRPNSFLERYGIIPPNVVGTTPDFFIGILLLTVFSAWLGWFPSGSIATIDTLTSTSGWGLYLTTDFWYHYTLPFLTVVIKYMYYPTLVMRGSVVEVRNQEFATYQRLLGLGKWRRFRHIMKHASLPVVTVLPAVTATSISGLVLIEIVFNWPGIGQLLLTSVFARDTPVIQFMFLLIAAWIVIGNFIVDIAYTIIDPRITIEGE
ncbi:peptide/nickel transport system permease protein [Halarchaeum rubridurum]|uniref:Peptide ABC transporter permease n=1 Tax=Halarchaeum rubridurum TaxID=489911 RepID=A0A830FQ55_9EURY|nr:ABC transporter permease [Halarchaeum rubridurum]MBP1954807.1 peptide/nickel transport system permease protein [Halarchaeum rubridurum]GGM59901.1 peptide ABC transporter permease [Halarchaeum rubridurum]